MADGRVEGRFIFKRLLRNISSYRGYISTKQLTVFKDVPIILIQLVRITLDADHLSAVLLAVRAAGLRRWRM